jgi:hypothetical protein
MKDWKPIETAPKDTMKSILLYTPEGVQIGWWCEGQSEWLTCEGKLLWADPTHWQPLPADPSE